MYKIISINLTRKTDLLISQLLINKRTKYRGETSRRSKKNLDKHITYRAYRRT